METKTEKSLVRVEYGAGELAEVPYASLSLLKQTRSHYDPTALVELAQSMLEFDDEDNATIVLLQRPSYIAFDSAEAAERYLLDFNLFHGTAYDASDLIWHNGVARVCDFGHRRTMAFGIAADIAGFKLDDLTIEVFQAENLSFEQALVRQLRENVQHTPPVEDKADAIHKYYEWRKQQDPEGIPPTIVSVAQRLAVSETTVRSALRYAQMPDEVKTEMLKGNVTYTDVVNMWHLHEALLTRGRQLESNGDLRNTNTPTADAYAAEAVLIDTFKIAKHRQIPTKDEVKQGRSWRKWNAAEVDMFIQRRVRDIRREMSEPDMMFDIEEVAKLGQRREAVMRGVGDGVIKLLDMMLRHDPSLVPEKDLEEFLQAVKNRRSQGELPDLFEES